MNIRTLYCLVLPVESSESCKQLYDMSTHNRHDETGQLVGGMGRSDVFLGAGCVLALGPLMSSETALSCKHR